MPTKIKPDYQPSQRVYELLKAYGVQNPVEFVGHEMGAFFLYWEGTGKAKTNWDSTCLNWMKRTYEDKKHAMAQNRVYGKSKPDLFQEVAGGMIAGDRPPQPKPVYRPVRIEHRPIPGEGETMSADDALDQLRRMSK